MSFGVTICKRTSAGVETTIGGSGTCSTSNTATRVAIVTTASTTLVLLSATVGIAQTAITANDNSITIRVWCNNEGGASAWTLVKAFQTEQLSQSVISGATWTVKYYVSTTVALDTCNFRVHDATVGNRSQITGFELGDWVQTSSDSWTTADALVKKPTKAASDSWATSDALIKKASKIFSESWTTIDALVRTASKSLSDSWSTVDSLLKTPFKALIESWTTTDSLIKSIIKVPSDSWQTIDALGKTVKKSLFDSWTTSDLLIKAVLKAVSDTWTTIDSLLKSHSKLLTDGWSTMDSLSKSISKNLSDSWNTLDPLKKSVGKIFEDIWTTIDVLLHTKQVSVAVLFIPIIGGAAVCFFVMIFGLTRRRIRG